MTKKRTNNLPMFFNYKEENTDNGYESMQDFFISWTLRCAVEHLKNENPVLQGYAKKMVYFLLYSNDEKNNELLERYQNDFFEITKISTKRQFGLIDLFVEIDYKINSNDVQRCVFNIENKWYSGIRNQQLEKSAEFIKNGYDCTIINIVLFCDYEKITDEVVLHCRNNNYKCLTVEELKDFSGIRFEEPSNNDIFDEYWLNFYDTNV